jgi:cell volume regulation protein A
MSGLLETRVATSRDELGEPRKICRCVPWLTPSIGAAKGATMASLDTVNITILFGSLLVLAGIMSSLIALRFGAPLLLVFLVVGMLAGEAGPGGLRFDDVELAYTVGSVALGLILFDGGLRTRVATFRSVLAPAGMLSTLGVLLTAALTAPIAIWALQLGWIEGLLVGAIVASTDAAAVFFLLHAKGLRLRPRVGATLEVESGTNDPFAIFLTMVLVEILLIGSKTWGEVSIFLLKEAVLGALGGPDRGRSISAVTRALVSPPAGASMEALVGGLVGELAGAGPARGSSSYAVSCPWSENP